MSQILTGGTFSCKVCHSKTPPPDGAQNAGLDLESLGYTTRLLNAPAKHTDLSTGAPANCASGDKLIDPDNPSASWLLTKVKGQPDCGTQMPPSPPFLTAAELSCVEQYISCVTGKPLSGSGGAGGTGGTGALGGSGGAGGG